MGVRGKSFWQRWIRTLAALCLFSSLLICHAEAAGDGSSGVTLSSDYSTKIWEAYTIGRVICLPLAAVSVAISAYKLLGDEKSQAVGKKQLTITLLAVAAMYILPYAIKLGVDLGKAYGWDPGG